MSLSELIIKVVDWFYVKPVAAILPRQTYRYAVCGAVNVVFGWGCYFLAYNYLFDKQLLDLGLVVLTPHVATMFFIFPFTFFRDSGSTATSPSAARRCRGARSSSATCSRCWARWWSTTSV